MSLFAEILIAGLLVMGGLFILVGSWGLARLPSLMTRLHGPTKATTLGVGGCLIASMIYFPASGQPWSAHELLITIFLLLTAPISANMIAKAHLHRQGHRIDPNPADDIVGGLPHPPGGGDWATYQGAAKDPAPTPEQVPPLRRLD
ncbi:MAG: Na+/H+ antiporter subunit G [Alphaproteobacteria bacterium]|jgi:multicomponent K+:H+ antiporter subunit G|nr:Na+/H+ antiporter subunit G [Alphaproteobacteria bacterium]MBU2040392.1 Na+/H+ antiporter subunit G [Alphaproteobacteria bacterium]MBU2126810.1 Na+/H+ antiporter subunit G [Alphaproteobacteria bacterium]MBU2208862.1 Na+/H+ antiporter subunit G [Alphaproteobacteria bacterium]MBU2291666.1 Na+/H+ antiporter subunit G [Alphaproteobacteria bacterium]